MIDKDKAAVNKYREDWEIGKGYIPHMVVALKAIYFQYALIKINEIVPFEEDCSFTVSDMNASYSFEIEVL